MPTYDVAIIGLGAMGGAALYACARRGLRVIGLEQAQPGHNRSSSFGESRIIRLSYFEDPAYVPLLRGAYRSWRDLEAFTGESLMTITGIVEAGHEGATLIEGSMLSAREHNLSHELLAPEAVNRRFPAFNLPPDWRAMYQPDGGILLSERAIGAFIKASAQLGATIRTDTRVMSVEPVGEGVSIQLNDGTSVEAGSAVVAAGSWIGALIPELQPSIKLTRQPLLWFEPQAPDQVLPEKMPVFFFQSREAMIYGFPNITGTGVKVASHLAEGAIHQPDDARSEVSGQEEKDISRFLSQYVPAAAGRLVKTHVCVYTRTPDEHFLLGCHPTAPQIVIASPCSGHGFKFASLFGEILCDLAHDRHTSWPIDLFRPERIKGF